ncbi:8020_t:CDS:2 [Entrophospora sp. SA101]|nr:14012_t:CDS:2 [Entrophospora sp. SA101]CAJ0758937.1 3108_t:CDS:2 [Entrophospora sp. SA101]CAJ0767320.1 8020_t:CDS:2 [Entrophospora sp. SA101]CAJ0825490.1 12191_t:CDS:2 [Entrophospora sp. SA101]
MFEAHLSRGTILKKLSEAIKELITDANFDCSEAGIALQAMDNSHIALVSLLLNSDIFSTYRCDRGFSLGVNLTTFNKLLKCAGNDDAITLKANEDFPETLTLSFDNSTNDKFCEYVLKLMNINQEHLSVPETEYDAEVVLSSAEFQRICRDMMVIGETVRIDIDKGEIKFITEGDLGNGKENIEINVTNEVSLQFSLKYLMSFTKGSPLSDQVKLHLAENTPLLVEYTLNSSNNSYLRYYLAPKLD